MTRSRFSEVELVRRLKSVCGSILLFAQHQILDGASKMKRSSKGTDVRRAISFFLEKDKPTHTTPEKPRNSNAPQRGWY